MNNEKRNDRGVTLVEMMVVVIIVGLLAGLAAFYVIPRLLESRQTKAKSDIETYAGAVEMFDMKCGRLPNTLDELLEKEIDGKKVGPFVKGDSIKKDPWGNEYDYQKIDSREFEITSYGKDGRPGGEDENADISNKSDRD